MGAATGPFQSYHQCLRILLGAVLVRWPWKWSSKTQFGRTHLWTASTDFFFLRAHAAASVLGWYLMRMQYSYICSLMARSLTSFFPRPSQSHNMICLYFATSVDNVDRMLCQRSKRIQRQHALWFMPILTSRQRFSSMMNPMPGVTRGQHYPLGHSTAVINYWCSCPGVQWIGAWGRALAHAAAPRVYVYL